MKIVDRKKFVRSLIIIFGLIMFVSFIFVNNSFSHSEVNYKKVFISSGDTLWNIAKQEKNNNSYFESKDIRSIVDEIKFTNKLSNSSLEIGQELNIPTI